MHAHVEGLQVQLELTLACSHTSCCWTAALQNDCHFLAGSEQHDFMHADLASVNRSRTPWLVVGGHRPFYIDSTSAEKVDSDQTVADDLRMAFEDLFLQYSVDLTLHGHHHSYQRSCPVFEGSCQEDLDGATAPSLTSTLFACARACVCTCVMTRGKYGKRASGRWQLFGN